MATIDYPITPGVRFLRELKIPFLPHLYAYEPKGGTAVSARELGVEEHRIIKTLEMESDPKHQFLVLMHGDKEVSTKQLARFLNVKSVAPANEQTANRVTGYQVGGISPFGTKQPLTVYAEQSIFVLPQILINGGKRGFLVAVDPADLKRVLKVTEVSAAV
jgi:Cys-tRNA(Pro) deacylase